MKDVYNVVQGLKPVMLMVLVQITSVGVVVLYKLALNDGMSLMVVVAYRYVFATAFIAPLALILERKKRAKMTWTILFQSFLCGLFGAFSQHFYLEALVLTSATFASALGNLTPAITIMMALCIGLERLNLRRAAGKAKIIGTLTGIGGAMVLIFVKGVEIEMGSFHVNLLHHKNGANPHAGSGGRTVLGAICVLVSNISYALWLIIQTKMSDRYPSHYSSTALISLWGSVTSIVFALCIERDWGQWRLGWNIRLLTVAYPGIVVSGVMVVVISWCVRMRGPLFASVFSPSGLVLMALTGSAMLNEKLHLGSIVGAVLIVCGLYVVLWGKSKEMKKTDQLVASQCPHETDTVEVVIRSSSSTEDKSNHDNNTHVNSVDLVSDNEDSSENRCDEHGRHICNKGIREEGELKVEEEISSNTSNA